MVTEYHAGLAVTGWPPGGPARECEDAPPPVDADVTESEVDTMRGVSQRSVRSPLIRAFPLSCSSVASAVRVVSFILLVSFVWFAGDSASAQDWIPVPLGTTYDIYAIENTYLAPHWVSGAHGFAARSNDSRSSWTAIETGTAADFLSVQEPGAGEVWFGAGGGTVRLRVYQFWFDRNVPDNGDFRLFTRRGAQAIAVGPAGRLYQSTDAGNNWALRQTGTTAKLNNGDGLPSGFAWAVGDSGTILRTDDGVSWTPVASGTTADLYGIAELDYTNVYVVGAAGTILKSTDGGLTWSAKPSGTSATLRAISISKQSQDHLIAAGLGGTVLRSTDAGETWCLLSATNADLYAAEAVSNTEFFVGGADGLLLRTINGGGPCLDVGAVAPGSSTAEGIRLKGPFPQPSTGIANFAFPARAGQSFRIEAFDAAGRLVRALPAIRAASSGTTTFSVDTHDWSPGVYLLRIRGEGGQTTLRMVVTG
jgi:hypothetical protein